MRIRLRLLAAGILPIFLLGLSGCGPKDSSPTGASQPEAAAKKELLPERSLRSRALSQWTTYHGNSELTGAVDAALPETPELLWRFKAGAAVRNTPVAGNGRIHFTDAQGTVFAIDLNGDKLWSKGITSGMDKNGNPIEEVFDAPAACFDSTVIVGSADGILYAFDSATGTEKWKSEISGPILGTPNRSYQSSPDSLKGSHPIFVIAQDRGVLHCLDFETGDHIWESEEVSRCDGSAAVGKDIVVFGSCAAALHVFSSEQGNLLRNIDIDADSQVAGGVALVGDSVFAGSRSGKIIHADTRTGKTLWINEDCEGEVFTTPAVNDEWVITSCLDGNLYALDRETGKKKWSFATKGMPSSPVIASDKVIVSADGILYLIGLEDGQELWSYEVSDEITSPAILYDMVIVGSEDGTVTAFGARKE